MEEENITVIVIAIAGGDSLRNCLQQIEKQSRQCLVVLGDSMGNVPSWKTEFPAVDFIETEKLPVPLRRQYGVDQASSEFVVLLEDTSIPEDGWLDAIVSAFEEPQVAAVGGPVSISPRLPARYQALACTEYGRFHPERVSQSAIDIINSDTAYPVTRIPGNNLAYRRNDLMSVLNDSDHGLIEGEVNSILASRGKLVVLHPNMAVVYASIDAYGARLYTRMQHGRLFASGRVGGCNIKTRISWFIKSTLLPFVLVFRGWRNMVTAIRPGSWPLVMSWIALMEVSWALGESLGYIAGAGSSLEAWH